MQFELDKVHQKYPDMRDIIVNQAEDMFQNSMTCYICGAKGHISIQCKYVWQNMPRKCDCALVNGTRTSNAVFN